MNVSMAISAQLIEIHYVSADVDVGFQPTFYFFFVCSEKQQSFTNEEKLVPSWFVEH